MSNSVSGTIERGQVISLTRRSVWCRQYEMRSGGSVLGWLQWQPWRCSFAQAEGRGIGPMDLATNRRRVVVAKAIGAEILATVDRERGGPVIHTSQGRALRWEKTARRNHWAICEQDQTLLAVAAAHGLVADLRECCLPSYGPRSRSACSDPCRSRPRCCWP